jgi:hypothetical protein
MMSRSAPRRRPRAAAWGAGGERDALVGTYTKRGHGLPHQQRDDGDGPRLLQIELTLFGPATVLRTEHELDAGGFGWGYNGGGTSRVAAVILATRSTSAIRSRDRAQLLPRGRGVCSRPGAGRRW